MAFLCGARNDEMSPGRLEGEVAPRLLAAVRQLEASMGLPVAGLA
jgi:hypothetical protein